MGKMSREKGKQGERDIANINRAHGFDSYRGVQYKGSGDSPDVIGLPGIHLEVKRVEKLQLWPSMEQATREAKPGEIPVVAHRPNRKPWIAILPYEKFLSILKKAVMYDNMQDDLK